MSFSEKQKGYHLQKMRTAAKRFDTNKDGYFSREDLKLMAEKLIERGKLTKEQAEFVHAGFMKYADTFDIKPGEMIPLEDLAQKTNKARLTVPIAELNAILHDTHDTLMLLT